MATVDYAAIRYVFIASLAASCIFSVGVIGLGIWILSDPSLISYWLNKIVVTNYGALTVTLRVSSYLPIGLGLVATVSFIIGLCHVLRGGKALLITYMVVTSVAVILEIVLAAVPMGLWSSVTSELPSYLQSTLKSEYRDIKQGASYPNSIIWDVIQIQLECCGYNGPTDFTTNYNTYASLWHNQYRYYQASSTSYSGMSYMFPVSCCVFADKSITSKQDFSNYENYVSNKLCPVNGVNYHSNSCVEPLKQYVYVYFSVILAASIVMLVVHSISLFLSGYLLKKRLVPETVYRPMSGSSLSGGLRRTTSGKVSPLAWQPKDRRRSRNGVGGDGGDGRGRGYGGPVTFTVGSGDGSSRWPRRN